MEIEAEKSLVAKTDDKLIRYLNKIVIYCVKALAILITFVIIWGVIDVAFHLFHQTVLHNFGHFDIENLLKTIGNFLAVLIVIEIFMNIVFYLNKHEFHVHLVLATALTAISRKLIVIDFAVTPPAYIYAAAAAIAAIGLAFWLVIKAQNSTTTTTPK